MNRCPSDCVFPEVRRSRLTSRDLPRLLQLQLPYRCQQCGQRFYKTSRLFAGIAALLLVLVLYPISYRLVGVRFEKNPSVKTFYQPLLWVEEQMLSGTAARVPGEGS